jgi:hypothetical protein
VEEQRHGSLDEDELVPLMVAARVAYFHVGDAMKQIGSEEHLCETAHEAAVALAAVAPIRRVADSGEASIVDGAELENLLFARDAKERPDLAALRIRRGDLRAALASLKEARKALGSA